MAISNRTFSPIFHFIWWCYKERKNLFKRLSFSCSFCADCLCFRSDAFNWGRVFIYFGNEGVTMRWGGGSMRQCAFIGTSYRAILHFLSLQQSSPTFSLFTRGIQPLPAVFHSSHPLFPASSFLSLLTFCERTIPPVHSSIEQITFWVAPSSRNSSYPRSFFPLFRAHIPVPSRIWMDIDHY